MKELNKIQVELKANKDLFNQFGGYGYRSTESILEAVKPLLDKYNCTIVISDTIIMIGTRYYVQSVSTIKNERGETESATAWAREAESKKGMDEAQITGAASSYARKYALCGLLAIDDRRDADSQKNGDGQPAKTDDQLKSEFTTAKKKIDGCKTRQQLVTLNEKCQDLWGYLPYVQYRDMKYNALPQ